MTLCERKPPTAAAWTNENVPGAPDMAPTRQTVRWAKPSHLVPLPFQRVFEEILKLILNAAWLLIAAGFSEWDEKR